MNHINNSLSFCTPIEVIQISHNFNNSAEMNSLSATGNFSTHPLLHSSKRRRFSNRVPPTVFSTLKTLDKYTGDNVLQDFVKERKLSGDFVAKISDQLWLKGVFGNAQEKLNLDEISVNINNNAAQLMEQRNEDESEGGFLKLKRTNEWLLGENDSAPVNKKMTPKEIRDDRDRRKRLNFLRYEALKRELFLLTVSIGAACTGYCLVVFSIQAAVSYAVGVSLSCLYFQLLCKHADNLSREMVPQIFTKKKIKKIGIRSQDLQDSFEKSVRGISIALSSPRLVFPAVIYGLWEVSQHFSSDLFEFQLVPGMLGLFAYKAACLVQVYRDNEDLQFIFPDDGPFN